MLITNRKVFRLKGKGKGCKRGVWGFTGWWLKPFQGGRWDQQLGYLGGVSVEVNVGSPGGVKGEGIGQRVLGI